MAHRWLVEGGIEGSSRLVKSTSLPLKICADHLADNVMFVRITLILFHKHFSRGERLCIGSYWYWKLSKSLEICHVLDGEIFLSMWCCRFLTDGTPSFEILYEGFRLCLCAASFVSILWTFLLDLELSETLDFSFAATQAVAGGAAEDLHDVNCNFQCLRHRDWRGEKLRVQIRDFAILLKVFCGQLEVRFHHNWQPKWSKQQKCRSATAWEGTAKHWTGRPLRVRLMQCLFHPWMRSYCGHLAQLHHMPTSGLPFALLRPLSKSLTLTYCPIQEARSRAQSAHSVASSTCYPRLVS